MAKELLRLSLKTVPNGYVLKVGSQEYMCFNIEQLLGGIFTHIAIEKTGYMDKDMVVSVLQAAATWKSVGEALEANASLLAETRKAHAGENAALRGQAAANERAEKAEKERDRLYEKKIALEAEILQLQASLKHIGDTLVGGKKSRAVLVEPKMTKGREAMIKESKKKGKSRYARRND